MISFLVPACSANEKAGGAAAVRVHTPEEFSYIFHVLRFVPPISNTFIATIPFLALNYIRDVGLRQ